MRPVFGIAVITPLVLGSAVSAAAPSFTAQTLPMPTAIAPMASVATSAAAASGPVVIAIQRPPASFHFAESALSAPPPPMIVNSPGRLGIPTMALTAYRKAEQRMATAAPGCGISWNLLAGIGRIESLHANGGATDSHGTAYPPIYGPALDGTLPGNEVIIQSQVGNRVTYARAMGPMQFLPGTWARYASDGNGNGVADPQNIFDSTLAAARYLCSGGLNLRDSTQVMSAILRYNNSMPYARNVLGWAAGYATGVFPVDLPPIVGPPPPLGDAHLEHSEGLGPGLPMNINGLAADDPMAHMPLINFNPPQYAFNPPQLAFNPPPMFPWMAPQTPQPGCTVICINSQTPPGAFPPGLGPSPFPPFAPPPAAPPPPNPLAPLAPPPPPNPLAPPAAPPPPDPLAPPAAPQPDPLAPPGNPPPGLPPAEPPAGAPPEPAPAGPPPPNPLGPPAPNAPAPDAPAPPPFG
ncbi:lytic transglycosylase [Mycobacterium spongiae]|uniref:Lytic transglycosylase n=2 Tax=Mycobacterium spongiae TaxID=886343 RepID=A0A975JZE6_9MYCO|nr:lytic transglycosylase [Mycobacterium spongiae]